MDHNSLITVVVYIYNSEKYIKRTIDSILNNSYKEIEVIIVDDASTDNSLSIVKELLTTNTSLKLIEQKEKLGFGKACNLIINKANGEYILFADTNDIIHNNSIKNLYTAIKDLSLDMVVGTISYYNKDKNIFEKNELLAYTPLKKYERKLIPLSYLQYNNITISSTIYGKLYRTNFIKENNISFSQINSYEDVKFWYSLLFAKNIKITFISDEVYSYHYSHNRQLNAFNTLLFDSYEEIKKLAIDHKNEIFLHYSKQYLTSSYILCIKKSPSIHLSLAFFKVARKYLLSGELSTPSKTLRISPLLAYYWNGLDKNIINEIINSNVLSSKLFAILKVFIS